MEELIPTLLLTATFKTLSPVELETLKGSKVVVPWMLKVTVEDVALIPATVPLSLINPWLKVLAPFQIETKPGLPLPMVVKPVSVAARVIIPGVEVVMVMLEPALKFHAVA